MSEIKRNKVAARIHRWREDDKFPEIDIEREALQVLDLIVAEFTSDPQSVQLVKSEAKTKAARENAKKGGWPKGRKRKP